MASSVHYYPLKVQFALSSEMDATALNEALDQVERDLFSSSQSQQEQQQQQQQQQQQWPQQNQTRWQLRKRPRQGTPTPTPTPTVTPTQTGRGRSRGRGRGRGKGRATNVVLPRDQSPPPRSSTPQEYPLPNMTVCLSIQFYFPKLVIYSHTDLKVNC